MCLINALGHFKIPGAATGLFGGDIQVLFFQGAAGLVYDKLYL